MEEQNPTAQVALDLLASEVEHLQQMVDILAGKPDTPDIGESSTLGKPDTTFSAEVPFGKLHTTLISSQDYATLTAHVAQILQHIHSLARKPGTT